MLHEEGAQAGLAQCGLPGSILTHLLTRGLLISAAALVSGLCTKLVLMRRRRTLRDHLMQHGEGEGGDEGSCPAEQAQAAQADNAVPFESFGVFLFRGLGLAPLLRKAEPFMEWLASQVSESLLTRLLCLPVCLYYGAHTVLARVNPEVSMHIYLCAT